MKERKKRKKSGETPIRSLKGVTCSRSSYLYVEQIVIFAAPIGGLSPVHSDTPMLHRVSEAHIPALVVLPAQFSHIGRPRKIRSSIFV
jgi:hypothetical protein